MQQIKLLIIGTMSEPLESDEFNPFFAALTKIILKHNILVISLTGKHLHNYLNMLGGELAANDRERKRFTVAMIDEKTRHHSILHYVIDEAEKREILNAITSQVAITQKREAVRQYVHLLEMPPPRTSELWETPEKLKPGAKTFNAALRNQVRNALKLDPDFILALGSYDDAAHRILEETDIPLFSLPIGNLGISVFEDLITDPISMGFERLITSHQKEFISFLEVIKKDPSMKHLYRLIHFAIKGIK